MDRYLLGSQLELDYKTKFSNPWRFRSQFLFSAQTNPDTTDQYEVFPKELNIEWRQKGWFTKWGIMTVSWEGTDGINPMDLFTAKDYRDPLSTQNLASAGIYSGWSNENHSLDFILIPWQTPSLLPKDHSAWWPRRLQIPTQSNSSELRLNNVPDYKIHNTEILGNALRANASARWQWRSAIGDFSWAVFDGASSLPQLQIIINAVPISTTPEVYEMISPVEIHPIIYRVRSGSMSYVLNWDKWILRTAGQHIQPTDVDNRIPGWSQQYVLGLERSMEWGQDNVVLLLQGSYGKRSDSTGLSNKGNIFEQAAMLGLRWPHGDHWILSISALYDLKTYSHYFGTQWTYRWNDEWSSDIKADILNGPTSTLFGVLSNRDRLGLNLNRSF